MNCTQYPWGEIECYDEPYVLLSLSILAAIGSQAGLSSDDMVEVLLHFWLG